MNTQQLDHTYIANTYARFPVTIARGKGSLVWDADDKVYIDMATGIAVNSFGIADPAWIRAVTEQLCTVQHASNLYYTAPDAQLAQLLCEKTGMKKVFFSNSGAESNECAIKAARKYASDQGSGRDTIITLKQSFHGRTITTLSATGQEHFHHHFGPFTPGFVHVTPGDVEELRAAASGRVCAIMLEMVQGEGGVVALDADYVARVAAFCREKDILVIVDEVQTGVGRTGKFLACEHFDLHPDIVTLAKGLGGGLPIGAVLMNKKVADHMKPGSHGSTFGGNPVCCAGALAVLDEMDDDFLANVNERAAQLRAGLAKLPHVREVSGLGLMVGIAFDDGIKAADVRAACEKAGLLVLTAKTRLRLLPPLILTADDVDDALAILRSVLEKCV